MCSRPRKRRDIVSQQRTIRESDPGAPGPHSMTLPRSFGNSGAPQAIWSAPLPWRFSVGSSRFVTVGGTLVAPQSSEMRGRRDLQEKYLPDHPLAVAESPSGIARA